MLSDQRLKAALNSEDLQQCLTFFRGMSEPLRREFAPQCIAWHKWLADGTQRGLQELSSAAVLATCNLSQIRSSRWHATWYDTSGSGEWVAEILLDRKPAWVEQFTIDLLEYPQNWRTIRTLVCAGLIDKPDHPNYHTGMIWGLVSWYDQEADIAEALLADPDLLDQELWKLFEYEGGGQISLTNYDRFARSDIGWCEALVSLARTERLPQARLLNSCMEALQRDFNHYRARWFLAFYDALEPTAEQQRAHAENYLHLLGMSAANVVSWALKKVEALAKADFYQADALLAGLRPVLESGGTGVVKRAVKLLGRAAKKTPACKSQVALSAVPVLAHEAPAVQEAALKLIDATGDADDTQLRQALASYREMVAPSLRDRIDAWAGQAPAEPIDAECMPFDSAELDAIDPAIQERFCLHALIDQPSDCEYGIPAATFRATELPQLAIHRPIVPVADIEQLVAVCWRVLEDTACADDVERAMDGLSRLCDLRSAEDNDLLTQPLLQRIENLLKRDSYESVPFTGDGPAADMLGMIHAWVTGEPPQITRTTSQRGHEMVSVTLGRYKPSGFARNMPKSIGFLSRRAYAMSLRLATARPSPLLSAPTHEGGWIDPLALAERIRAWQGDEPNVTDVVLAMLRCAPDHRQQAMASLAEQKEEWARAIRYALGGPKDAVKEDALWRTAAWVRQSHSIEAEAGSTTSASDVPQPVDFQLSFKSRTSGYVTLVVGPAVKAAGVDENCIPLVLLAERDRDWATYWELGGIGGRTEQSIRWTSTIWPAYRESFFAAAAVDLAENIDWGSAYWQHKAYLEPMLDLGTPLAPMGTILLAIGLGCKEPGEHVLATDIAIAAIADGRLGTDNLGKALSLLLPSGIIKPNRWQKTLREVARASSVHAAVVKGALEEALGASADRMPRNAGTLCQLLLDLSVEIGCGVTDKAACRYLQSLTGSSKAAKSAKALLQIQARSIPDIAKQAAKMRIQALLNVTVEKDWHTGQGQTRPK